MLRIRRWLRNPRNYALLGGLSAGLVMAVKACPLLFPNQLYRPIMEAYKGGSAASLTEEQRREFQEVLEDLRLQPGAYHPFITSRWEVKVKGQPYLPSGVLVGIPATFVDDPRLPRSTFAEDIRDKLDSEEGVSFRDSMTLSRDARKFSLAKGVVHADRCYDSYPLLIAPATVIVGFATTFAIQVLAGMFPLSVTGALVGTTFFITYRFLSGQLNEKHDIRSDKIVASLGRSYVEGGLEFYEQDMKRNRALRELLGKKGKKMFSYYGNRVTGTFSSDGAPLTVKRKKLSEMSKQFPNDSAELEAAK